MTNVITSRFNNTQFENKKMIMKNVKLFEAKWDTIILRYYLMMAIVLAAGFSGYNWLAVFAFPVFLSSILGVKFQFDFSRNVSKSNNNQEEKKFKMVPVSN